MKSRIQGITMWFWHWSATWKWWDGLFAVAYLGSLSVHEFALAEISLILCAFSLISLIWHKSGWELIRKGLATFAVCAALVFLNFVTIQEKENHPWSHLFDHKPEQNHSQQAGAATESKPDTETAKKEPPLPTETRPESPRTEPPATTKPKEVRVKPQGSPVVKVEKGGKWISEGDTVYAPGRTAIENQGEVVSKNLKVNPPPGFPQEQNARLLTGTQGALAEYDYAKKLLASDPDQLTLYDLYLTDFEPSEVKHSRTLVINTTPETRLGAAVVWQVEAGSEFVMFYIPYNRTTDQWCLYTKGQYRRLLEEAQRFKAEMKKPGDSEQVTSTGLVFSNRVFIYHETYLSPEQTIFIRNAYAAEGVTVVFRSTDYLSNRKLDAKVKMLEKK